MHIKVLNFQVVHFKALDPITKEPQEPILIYALGNDGIIYEFNGRWMPLPIDTENLRELKTQMSNRQ